MSEETSSDSTSRNYHTNTVAEGGREREQDIDSRIQPLRQLFVGALRLIKGLYLGLKNGENGTGRVAGLELGGQGMGGNVFLRLIVVRLQSSCKNGLKVCGRGGRGRKLGHSEVEGAGWILKGEQEGRREKAKGADSVSLSYALCTSTTYRCPCQAMTVSEARARGTDVAPVLERKGVTLSL